MRADVELLDAWRAGDPAAGDRLVQRHFDGVCRFFRSKLGDDVDDLIQRTFLRCVETRDRVQTSFRAYLFGIARHVLMDHLRSRYAHGARFQPGSCSVVDLGTSPSRKLARSEEHALLLRALRSIPLDYQLALELAYWEELSGREIAQALGIAEPTVRSRLTRARAALRAALETLDAPRAAHALAAFAPA